MFHLIQILLAATVTSQQEEEFLLGLTAAADGVWTGGLLTNLATLEYRWVTGPESGQLFSFGSSPSTCLTYCNWNGPFEPSGDPNGGIEFYGLGAPIPILSLGTWNDLPISFKLDSFFVEVLFVDNCNNELCFVSWTMLVIPFTY